MPPVNETERTAEWIFETLKADATLTAVVGGGDNPRIHENVAPGGSSYPVVVFQVLAPVDVGTHNSTRIMTRDIWMVKGIDRDDAPNDDLKTIADRIEAVLHRSAGGVAGDGTVFTSVRERAIRYPEDVEGGVRFRHLGGEYRIYTQVPVA